VYMWKMSTCIYAEGEYTCVYMEGEFMCICTRVFQGWIHQHLSAVCTLAMGVLGADNVKVCRDAWHVSICVKGVGMPGMYLYV
jgi:hypothetical protein